MSDLLSISSAAVMTYQSALGTVSNNIANVGTDGYVRQESNLVENSPRKVANVYLGTGVRFAGIRRAYDEYLETNVRNSGSELNTQQPMIDFANRIIDIMGSDTIGLSPALNKFFETSQLLSTDPSSNVLRAQFLRDADGLAGRFRELSSQVDSVDTDTREATQQTLDQINTLSKQIALVNKQLAREVSVERQSPELLDQRDRLLKQLSKLVRINVATGVNGTVNISVSNSQKVGLIVNGQESIDLGVRFDGTDLGRVTIIADPYGAKETIAGITSGELGGLLTFREQMLQPTSDHLNFLAQTMVDQVNQIHTGGIDLYGEVGKDLFKIDQVKLTDPLSGEVTLLNRASAGMKIAINDTARVAAAGMFRVIENDMNLSNADATLSYKVSYADPATIPALSTILKNNADPSAGIAIPQNKIIGQIPLGSSDWSLFLDGASGNQQLQVFTRDGNQLLGAPLADDAEQRLLLTEKNGFFPGSTYATRYLNQSGQDGYRQLSLFYGLVAKPIAQYGQDTQFTLDHAALPSLKNVYEDIGQTIPDDLAYLASGHLSINGKLLPQLYPTPPSRTLQASDVASWMNRALEGTEPVVGVNAITKVELVVNDPAAAFYINGVKVPQSATGRTLSELAEFINAKLSSTANVEAAYDTATSKLILKNTTGYGGRDIRIGQPDATGGLGVDRAYKGKLIFPNDGTVTIGYGPAGQLGDLDKLGKPVGNYYTAVLPRVNATAKLEGLHIPAGVQSISEKAITINGLTLGGLDLDRTLHASDMAQWINRSLALEMAKGATKIRVSEDQYLNRLGTASALSINGTTISGSGTNGVFTSASDLVEAINAANTGTLRVPEAQIRLSSPLVINGVTIRSDSADGSFSSSADLATWINLSTAVTGVSADVGSLPELVLSNAGNGNIVVGPNYGDNALGIDSGTYAKVHAEIGNDGSITITNDHGGNILIGSPSASNVLGISNAIYSGLTGIPTSTLPVIASGYNEIRAPLGQYRNNLSTGSLSINGVEIQSTSPTGFKDGRALVQAINDAATGDVTTTSAALDLTRKLVINGVRIFGSNANGSFTTEAELVTAVNAQTALTGVTIDDSASPALVLKHVINGDIVIGPSGESNALGVVDGTYSKVIAQLQDDGTISLKNGSGADIVLGSPRGNNLLGLGNGPYKGTVRLESKDEIKVGFGTLGNPSELAKLGLRTGIYIDGAAPEDLLVIATGEGSGTVAGSYNATMKDPASLSAARIDALRAQDLDITFVSANRYQITWKNPANKLVTILAERDYDPKAGIAYQGLKLTLNKTPMSGDTFRIDGNQDGKGNNEAVLNLVALQKKKVIGGVNGSTIAESYEEAVGKIGNFANQATIAQKALQVVNDQAVQARDKVSGVSLDKEAGDLIRFQQAYQASAKAMQVANTLFDAILRV